MGSRTEGRQPSTSDIISHELGILEKGKHLPDISFPISHMKRLRTAIQKAGVSVSERTKRRYETQLKTLRDRVKGYSDRYDALVIEQSKVSTRSTGGRITNGERAACEDLKTLEDISCGGAPIGFFTKTMERIQKVIHTQPVSTNIIERYDTQLRRLKVKLSNYQEEVRNLALLY